MEYLKAMGKLSPSKLEKGENALQEGVKNTLKTQIKGGDKAGAFTIWGTPNDWSYKGTTSDSIWLTAYVAKCFGKAKKLIAINSKVIFDALKYLSKNQDQNGKFLENGRVSYYKLQTDSSEGIPLTAFVTIAFLENIDSSSEDSNSTIEKGLDYIDKNYQNITDNYALAIASYALALGNHNSAKSCLDSLIKKAFITDDYMYWKKDMQGKPDGSTPESTMIEMAAYAVLAHVQLKASANASRIVNWLVSRRNSKGGFSSTQDTVIGLQALSASAPELNSKEIDMDIKVTTDKGDVIKFKLKDTQEVTMLGEKLKKTVKTISFYANGTGTASLQFSQSYKLSNTYSGDDLKLEVTVIPENKDRLLTLRICTQDLSKDQNSGMMLVEVTLPSGYIVDPTHDLLLDAEIKVNIFTKLFSRSNLQSILKQYFLNFFRNTS